MGIDLRALASNFREHGRELLPTASVRFDRDSRLLAAFSPVADPCIVQPLPGSLRVGHYEDDGLKFDEVDRYGNRLTYTTADQVRRVATITDISQWNRAVLGFLLSLPSDTKIVLYWC